MRMRRAALSALVGCAITVLGCRATEEDVPRSNARALGMFSRELPAPARDQARVALSEDAWRREHRFSEAEAPGFLLESTRIDAREISTGRRSWDEIYQVGAQLFTYAFTARDGFDAAKSSRFGGGAPDARSCRSCHWRGGLAGAGDGADNAYIDGNGTTQSSSLARNPPSLAGAGYVEILAQEMTRDLARQREVLQARATREGRDVREHMVTKGVSFGFLSVRADGSVDAGELEGIADDLVVRPFGRKGHSASVTAVVSESFARHHGANIAVSDGQRMAVSLFIAMQDVPIEENPRGTDALGFPTSEAERAWRDGRSRFTAFGCAACHTPELPIESTVFTWGDVRVDLAREGAEPRLTGTKVALFSDLKRHAMGKGLADARGERGILADVFVTPPLWGIAKSAPYLHDGRAPTLEDAIVLHGGEALDARNAYASASEADRAAVRVFLTSLTRARRLVAR